MFSKESRFRLLLLAAGIAMLCFGAVRGEADTVLSKAIRLCWSVWALDKKKFPGFRPLSRLDTGGRRLC